MVKYAIVSSNMTRKKIVEPPILNHSGRGLTSLPPILRNCASNLKYRRINAVTTNSLYGITKYSEIKINRANSVSHRSSLVV